MDNTFGNISDGAKNALDKFSSNKHLSGTSDFLNSNSIVAKFAFLLLVIIVFIVLLQLGAALLTWFMEPDPNPILVKGTDDGKTAKTFTQDPNVTGSVPILRSINDVTGIEFTWSIWLLIDGNNFKRHPDSNNPKYKHIFHKGEGNFDRQSGLSTPNNSPGLYLDTETNNLLVVFNTFDEPTPSGSVTQDNPVPESVEITDIPLNKWMNVIIRVSKQNQVDIYINGTLMKREILNGVIKQNYGNVYLTNHGGFNGYTSSLRYFNKAIGTNHIQTIIDDGPNLKMLSGDLLDTKPRYLSTRWFFSDSNNLYNP